MSDAIKEVAVEVDLFRSYFANVGALLDAFAEFGADPSAIGEAVQHAQEAHEAMLSSKWGVLNAGRGAARLETLHATAAEIIDRLNDWTGDHLTEHHSDRLEDWERRIAGIIAGVTDAQKEAALEVVRDMELFADRDSEAVAWARRLRKALGIQEAA